MGLTKHGKGFPPPTARTSSAIARIASSGSVSPVFAQIESVESVDRTSQDAHRVVGFNHALDRDRQGLDRSGDGQRVV